MLYTMVLSMLRRKDSSSVFFDLKEASVNKYILIVDNPDEVAGMFVLKPKNVVCLYVKADGYECDIDYRIVSGNSEFPVKLFKTEQPYVYVPDWPRLLLTQFNAMTCGKWKDRNVRLVEPLFERGKYVYIDEISKN